MIYVTFMLYVMTHYRLSTFVNRESCRDRSFNHADSCLVVWNPQIHDTGTCDSIPDTCESNPGTCLQSVLNPLPFFLHSHCSSQHDLFTDQSWFSRLLPVTGDSIRNRFPMTVSFRNTASVFRKSILRIFSNRQNFWNYY